MSRSSAAGLISGGFGYFSYSHLRCPYPPVGGPLFVGFGGAPPPTEARMRFCYDFVIETALNLQTEQRALDAVLEVRHE